MCRLSLLRYDETLMRRRGLTSFLLTIFLLLQSVPAFAAPWAALASIVTLDFRTEIDAFSVRLPLSGSEVRYSYVQGKKWSPWIVFDNDGDSSRGEESELVMLPSSVRSLRVQGVASREDVHPIHVSKDPVSVRVASKTAGMNPSIIRRREWGADESYLFDLPTREETMPSAGDIAKGDTVVTDSVQSGNRIKDCLEAQQKYGSEFKIASTLSKDSSGKSYRWPLQYSSAVKLLVVHHSALNVNGDPRPPIERIRALYKYHALTKGWGDIGYHFVVDENGQVYEGREGGTSVVGGHAYCNNVGTIGIVLMGNFELEQPSQVQVKGLQRLLSDLSHEYGIDVTRSVQFHGKTFASPVVGHRDLLSTLCPGYSLFGVLSQIVAHLKSGELDASVQFPPPRSSSSSSAFSSSANGGFLGLAEGISFIGRTAIDMNPSGKQRLSFAYTAGEAGAYEGKKIGDVRLSSPSITLMQDDGIHHIPVRKGILLQTDLPAGESVTIQLIVQAPPDAGSYSMEIAGLRFTLSVAGRRARAGEFINPFAGNPVHIVHPTEIKRDAALTVRSVSLRRSRQISSSSPSTFPALPAGRHLPPSTLNFPPSAPSSIRIRLSASPSPTITFQAAGRINDTVVPAGTSVHLFARGSECFAAIAGTLSVRDRVLRLQSQQSEFLTIDAVRSNVGAYKGVLECRVLEGSLVLINELPLEDYMAGLAEEPDSEPYEKQRAFAIAARTYGAYYMQSSQRKFPSMPYDGSDSPAEFQFYLGLNFGEKNPQWLRAVSSTAHQVLRSSGQLIKSPYFSSDDGRTRSPAEAGWKNFPFAEIFASKRDPWCAGLPLSGHGVGMSGCGARGQAIAGSSAEQILQYYYPGVRIQE